MSFLLKSEERVTVLIDFFEEESNKRFVSPIPDVVTTKYNGHKQEERQEDVSTTLCLYLDPWKIKKRLTDSDLGSQCRLLIKASLVKKYILPFFNADRAHEVDSINGCRVEILDQDTNSKHHLVFKLWNSSKSYVFIDGWKQNFVLRRDLKEGDEIGLYWNPYSSRFTFCVLNRAPRIQLRV